MKTLTFILFLLPAVCVGQVFDKTTPLDSIKWGASIPIGKPHHHAAFEAMELLLERWDSYKAECYADSVVCKKYVLLDSLGTSPGLTPGEWKIVTYKKPAPRDPTFPGFMEYLRRKQTQERK